MRKYHKIDLSSQTVKTDELQGEDIVRGGRYFVARALNDMGAATVDPLSAENPLVFAGGPFAGTNFSNANRVSIGCKSPLTGGIKEANGGGTLAFALGQLEIFGFTLQNACDEWTMIHIKKGGEIEFHSAADYMGEGNFATAAKLHERFGKKVSLVLCGPVGEYQGLLAGIAISDVDLRPSRLAARGGVGAVMGQKKVKAIIVDLNRMPPMHDRKRVMGAVKEYRKLLDAAPAIKTFQEVGTAMMADYANHIGGIPVRNFTAGTAVDTKEERFKLGGEFLREQNLERGGEQTHACMPGCIIQCSNVYADADGNEVVSPVEYETIGLLGTNCGLTEPDDLAALNYQANDLGIDTIEVGGTIAVLMEAGHGEFGDAEFMHSVMDELRAASEKGKFYARGTGHVGRKLGVARVPVIKNQTISAYDPRVIEVTGITMMTSAQGADHTAGNLPHYETEGKSAAELVPVSLEFQAMCAAADAFGLCNFGRTVTNEHHAMMIQAMTDAHNVELPSNLFEIVGRETLELENKFNRDAGIGAEQNALPDFFYDEALPPTDMAARFSLDEINTAVDNWWH